jgi:opacity protein-like surface antigen
MKIKGLMAVAITAILLASQAKAADDWSDRFKYEKDSTTKYMPNEFSLDLFGTYATRDRYGHGDDNWGGGLGLNYFFTRYIGIGADSYLEEWKAPYRANGSLFVRIPIDSIGLAPYAFGGGGREWKYVPQWTLHAGGGLELRFNPHFGLFADGRRVFPDRSQDYALWRAGVRFGF